MKFLKAVNPAVLVVIVLALLAAAVVLTIPRNGSTTLTADFPRAVSLYAGSDVKILGVTVGKVDAVDPTGTRVAVKMSIDGKYKIPADAKAVVISPSIVGDRFVQLTPVYTGGPQLPDGAKLGLDRTAVPLELDQIFGSITDLTTALGPEGANKPDQNGVGALTRLLDSTARNFGGQGVQFNQTLKNLAKFTKTLADNKDNFFGTLSEIETFTQSLAANDDVVRRFNDSLAQGANLLAGERQDMAKVLQNLSTALTEVKGFVQDNRDVLSTNIKELNKLSTVLVKNRDALNESLSAAPVALDNLALAYNPTTGTLDTRANIGETATKLTNSPDVVLCALLPDACDPISSVLGILGLARPAPMPASGDPVTVVDPIDRSLGGLLEVAR